MGSIGSSNKYIYDDEEANLNKAATKRGRNQRKKIKKKIKKKQKPMTDGMSSIGGELANESNNEENRKSLVGDDSPVSSYRSQTKIKSHNATLLDEEEAHGQITYNTIQAAFLDESLDVDDKDREDFETAGGFSDFT
jgi:hypothetical protein